MDRETEIAQIRHELEILRSRHALYEKWGRILRIFFMIWVPLFAVAVLALLVKLFLNDAAIGVLGLLMGVIVSAIAALLWLARNRNPPAGRRRSGWIDLASPLTRPFGLYPGVFAPHPYINRNVGPRSDAELIEQQIAEREQRLAELGVRS